MKKDFLMKYVPYNFLSREIIKKQSKIIARIFNSKNKKICSVCDIYIDGNNKPGCCAGCFKRDGYYENTSEEILTSFKKDFGFSKKTGFFDDIKKTCKIPRELRSFICLKYYCLKMNLTEHEKAEVWMASKIIKMVKKTEDIPT